MPTLASTQLCQQLLGNLIVGIGDDLAAFLVDHVVRQHAAQQVILRHRDLFSVGFLHFAHMLDGDALILRDDQFAALGDDVKARDVPAQTLRHQFELDLVL